MKALLLLGLLTSYAVVAEQQSDSFSASLNFAQVQYVEAKQSSNDSWCFNTRVRHQDEGWDHYADVWQVHDINGNLLAERVLLHPHDNEQPFTRSLCGIYIPDNMRQVVVSAQCKQHGVGGHVVVVDLAGGKGSDFSVEQK
tara:strand:+ start:577 stop:999 length:423 start_codon:yes stop_codon:yes gene_type:complete